VRDRRVLFLTHAGDPGGAEYKMLDLCRSLGERAEVMLLQHGSLEELLDRYAIAYCVRPLTAAIRGVRREARLSNLLKAIPGALGLIRAVAREGRRFDVVVCFSQKSFVLAALAKPFMRRPILWFMNDILSRSHFSRASIRLLVLLSRFGANHIVVNSQASLQAWRAAGGRECGVSVVYPGVPDEQVASQLQDPARIATYRKRFSPDERPLIGMCGRISRWKGQDVFLRAIARVVEVNAVIVGEALFDEREHEGHVRRLAIELGLETRVTFAGHVSDVIALMAACDVVVHCSTAPEPFGLVIAEAMLAGAPVIASDAGGAREIVVPGATGQLTPPSDWGALAEAIRRCLADPRWAQQMAQLARVRAREKFSVSAMVEGFRQTLEAL
jgi:glycosyltransferase involved in cell wall biosynthesis